MGDVLPLSGCPKVDVDERSLLLLLILLFFHSRRILFTLMREALEEGCFTALVASSEVTESNENLLDGVCDGGRPSSAVCPVGAPSAEFLPRGPASSGKCCESAPSGASGADGYRPKGSGDSGMTGESALRAPPSPRPRGGYSPCSSASARCRARVSFEIDPGRVPLLARYITFGGSVEMPLNANLGGEGGASGSFSSSSLIIE